MLQFEKNATKYWTKYERNQLSHLFMQDEFSSKKKIANCIGREFFRHNPYRKMFIGILIAFSYEKKREKSLRGLQKFSRDIFQNNKINSLLELEKSSDIKYLRPHYSMILNNYFDDFIKFHGERQQYVIDTIIDKINSIGNWDFD